MFKFCSLYSGSTGNSLFVQSDSTKILIDISAKYPKYQEYILMKIIKMESNFLKLHLLLKEQMF